MQRHMMYLPGEVIVFDLETTGTDRQRDQVIELCVQSGLEADAPARTWRIKPSVNISPGAQAVHGITMEALADCPLFDAYADEIAEVFSRAQVWVGYNMGFDIEMLQAEYARLRRPRIDVSGKQLIDAYRLWQQCEPRSLQHAHQRFVGDSFSAAHSATADVAATGRVLRGMLASFGLPESDWTRIAAICEPERATWLGPSRHVRWGADGIPELGFGRHAGTPMHELARFENGDYLRWILAKDFPPHVRAICRKALELSAYEFHRWVSQAFGERTAGTAAGAGIELASLENEPRRDTENDNLTPEPSLMPEPLRPPEPPPRPLHSERAERAVQTELPF